MRKKLTDMCEDMQLAAVLGTLCVCVCVLGGLVSNVITGKKTR